MLSHLVCYQALAFWVERHSENDSSHHVHATAAKCSMTLPLGYAHRALIVALARQNSIGCSAAVSFSTFSPKLAQGHQLSCSQGLSSNQYPVLLNFCKCQSGGFYTEKKFAQVSRDKTSQKLHTVQFFGFQDQYEILHSTRASSGSLQPAGPARVIVTTVTVV